MKIKRNPDWAAAGAGAATRIRNMAKDSGVQVEKGVQRYSSKAASVGYSHPITLIASAMPASGRFADVPA